jgi:hypothetical protein
MGRVKMKIKSAIIAIALGVSLLWAPAASANQKPVIESFTFTPNDIDLLNPQTTVDIELVVSHPSGISNTSTLVTLKSATNDTFVTYLTRTDSPVNSALTKVTFKGSLVVPRDITTGVYNFSIANIKNNSSAGYQFETDPLNQKKIRNIVGAEYGLLIRSGGDLNLNYDTFVGPSYDSTLGISFNDSIKYNPSAKPIWKVGETYTPSKYNELRVSTLSLGITSSTPLTCSSDGKELKLLKEGLCVFIVSTAKTKDYLAKISNQTVMITAARIKSELAMEKIANQTAKDLPKLVEIFRVYSASEGFILPKSATPEVCFPTGYFVRIISGGTCTITYQTSETATYLASDLYKVSFDVVRDPQTISFTLPSTVNVSSKSLALTATASSGAVITYSTTSTGICSITGSTLNLLMSGNCAVTATQVGTSTLAPTSSTATVMLIGAVVTNKKSITCVKGKSTKKVSGTNPKCPKGYKLKK